MATRMVTCVSISDDNQKYPDALCDQASRPENRKSCHSDIECPPMWHASEWSRVSTTRSRIPGTLGIDRVHSGDFRQHSCGGEG